MRFLSTFILLFAFGAVAAQESNVEVRQQAGTEVFKVFFQTEDMVDVSIKLKSQKGKTLFAEKMYADGFMKPYNLQNLPNGNYYFEIGFEENLVEKPFILGTPKVAKVKKDRRVKAKDIEKVLIAQNETSKVKISLIDENIEAVSIFFYLEGTDEFEYFYWEPSGKNEYSYDLDRLNAEQIRVEVVENGKILAEKAIAKNW